MARKPKTPDDKTKKPKAITTQIWVEIVNGIFKDAHIAEKYTYETYRDNIFMVNQSMAKMYPIEAQAFNKSNVNPVDVVRFWSFKLFGTSFRVPSWVYMSPKKEEKAVDHKKYIPGYCDEYDLDVKDVEMDYFLYSDIMEERLIEYKELLDARKENASDIEKNV